MSEWRFLRGWTDAELAERLRHARTRQRNFTERETEMTPARGWGRHYSTAIVGREIPGPPVPNGAFERAWPHVERYAFSDPRIVRGHFDEASPLLGRVMLIEARVLGFRYLGAAVVASVRDDRDSERSVRGFRYDTLEGHFERGMEWFLLTKEHATGDVTFTVHAGWQRGELPNVWSRIGFHLLVQRYQRAWHRLAHLRMRALLGSMNLEPLPRGSRLVHSGPPLPITPVQHVAAGAPPAPITTEREARETVIKEMS